MTRQDPVSPKPIEKLGKHTLPLERESLPQKSEITDDDSPLKFAEKYANEP